MSGHSKWANIKNKKEKADNARGKIFTKIGREIAIAVKEGGSDPNNNSKLRDVIAKAKANNMPNDNISRSIKKAAGEMGSVNYEEITYEGYGPHGIAIFVEAATDNNTRTVANVRSYFTKHGGSLGTQGSLTFLFDHKVMLKIAPKADMSLEDLELELIDYGVDELEADEDSIVLYGPFEEYSNIQQYLEGNGFEILSTEFVRIPNDVKEVTDEQRETIDKLLEKLEEDEDVQNVFHNMAE